MRVAVKVHRAMVALVPHEVGVVVHDDQAAAGTVVKLDLAGQVKLDAIDALRHFVKHCSIFEAVEQLLVLVEGLIMIAGQHDDLTLQAAQVETWVPEAEVAQVEDRVLVANERVPVCNQSLVHLVGVGVRTV